MVKKTDEPEKNAVVDKDDSDDVRDDQIPATKDISIVNAEILTRLQKEDPTLRNCKEQDYEKSACVENIPKAFYWDQDILRRKWTSADNAKVWHQVVLPACLRDAVIKLAHDQPLAGHLSVEKTKERILKAFY